MGIYFNPGNGSFTEDKNSQIYIDKTELLKFLNKRLKTNGKCIAVSHARHHVDHLVRQIQQDVKPGEDHDHEHHEHDHGSSYASILEGFLAFFHRQTLIDKEADGDRIDNCYSGSFRRRHNAGIDTTQNDDGHQQRGNRALEPSAKGNVFRHSCFQLFGIILQITMIVLALIDVDNAQKRSQNNAWNNCGQEARQDRLSRDPSIHDLN